MTGTDLTDKLERLYQFEEGILDIGKPFGASDVMLSTKDGRRNLKIAIYLDEHYGIPVRLSQEEHGPDAYMLHGFYWLPVEMKSCFPENNFEFHCDTGNAVGTLYGLINRVHVYAVFNRPNGRGVDTISDLEIRWPGSYYHNKLTVYRESVLAGGPYKRQSVSMAQIKRGADRPFPKTKQRSSGGLMKCLEKAGMSPSASTTLTQTTI